MSHAARLRFAVALLGGWGCSPAPEAPGDPLDDALDETIDRAAEAQSDCWRSTAGLRRAGLQRPGAPSRPTRGRRGHPGAGFFQHGLRTPRRADEHRRTRTTGRTATSRTTRTDADIMVEARPPVRRRRGAWWSLEMQPPMDGHQAQGGPALRHPVAPHQPQGRARPGERRGLPRDRRGHGGGHSAAPWVHTQTDRAIPPGASMSIEVDCAFDADVHLLSVWAPARVGASYSVDHDRADGTRRGSTTSSGTCPPGRAADHRLRARRLPLQQGVLHQHLQLVNDTPDVLGSMWRCAPSRASYLPTVPMICSAD